MKRGRPRLHPDGLRARITVDVSDETHDRLSRLALLRRVSLSSVVRDKLARDYSTGK